MFTPLAILERVRRRQQRVILKHPSRTPRLEELLRVKSAAVWRHERVRARRAGHREMVVTRGSEELVWTRAILVASRRA